MLCTKDRAASGSQQKPFLYEFPTFRRSCSGKGSRLLELIGLFDQRIRMFEICHVISPRIVQVPWGMNQRLKIFAFDVLAHEAALEF
jgi:hypothetical protein